MVMTVIYLVLSLLTCFYKADFLNLACATIAMLMLSQLHIVKPKYFRLLVVGIVLSLGVDVFWFIIKGREYLEDDMDDMEGVVRKFSLITAVLSFFYKLVMCIVFWMASIELVKAKDDEERKKLLE